MQRTFVTECRWLERYRCASVRARVSRVTAARIICDHIRIADGIAESIACVGMRRNRSAITSFHIGISAIARVIFER